jgi:hypothetical protein
MIFNPNKTGELIVKPRVAPRTKLLVAVLVAVGLIFTAGWIYNYGLSVAGFHIQSASREQESLRSDIKRLEEANEELRVSLARAQRTLQMDQSSYQELDRSLKASAQEITKLREELNFYRNIISPVDKKAGLRIQSLAIEPVGNTSQFRYKLVLIQALKHDRSISGTAQFEISGMQAGQDSVLTYPKPPQRTISVNFKYFQDIEGKFELPRNFKPRQIKVTVTTAGGTQNVEEIYTWPLA